MNSRDCCQRLLKDFLSSPRLSSCPLPVAVTPPSDQVYMQAAAVFRQLRPEKPARQQHLRYGRKPEEPASKDETVARRAYQLAFNTLKCTVEKCAALFTVVLVGVGGGGLRGGAG